MMESDGSEGTERKAGPEDDDQRLSGMKLQERSAQVHKGECVSPKLMCDYYRH